MKFHIIKPGQFFIFLNEKYGISSISYEDFTASGSDDDKVIANDDNDNILQDMNDNVILESDNDDDVEVVVRAVNNKTKLFRF